MLNRFRPVLTLAVWLAASTALAQTPPPATRAVASANGPAEVEKQTRSFVQAYAAPTPRIDQIARWRDPICVQVTGLAPDNAALIKSRVEDVAKAVGQGVGAAGCPHNVEIAFTDQPQALLDGIAARQAAFLGYHHRDARTLKTVTRPIQAWYVTATLGGGGPNAGALFSFSDNGGSQGSLPVQTRQRITDDPDVLPPTGCGDSPFTSCRQSVFDNVLVVVDSSRVKDKSVGLLSDYVAMIVLSQPRSLDGCNVLPSVIDLFAPACPGPGAPDGLTPADAAYLTALYAADLQANKLGEQSDIARRMARILAPAGGVAR